MTNTNRTPMAVGVELQEGLLGPGDNESYRPMTDPEDPAHTTPGQDDQEPASWIRPWPFTAGVLLLVNLALVVGVTILGVKLQDRSQCVSYPAPSAM